MKVTPKVVVGTIAVAALTFLLLKLLFGNNLLGSPKAGTSKVDESKDENKIAQLGKLSDLEAKFNGMIDTSESKDELALMIKATAERV